MSVTMLGFVLLAILGGVAIAVQLPLNVAAGSLMGHPLGGATLSFIAGGVFLALLSTIVARHQIVVANVWSLSPALYLGGILGAIYVTLSIFLTPKLGAGAVLALAIAGQVTGGLLLDHFGALGLATREITLGRASGAVLVLAGALMVKFL